MDFQARYVLINTSAPEILEQRLKSSGKEDSTIQEILKKSSTELEPGKVNELFDTTVVDDDDVAAVKTLSNYIYGGGKGEQGSGEDTAMKDKEDDITKAVETKGDTMADA